MSQLGILDAEVIEPVQPSDESSVGKVPPPEDSQIRVRIEYVKATTNSVRNLQIIGAEEGGDFVPPDKHAAFKKIAEFYDVTEILTREKHGEILAALDFAKLHLSDTKGPLWEKFTRVLAEEGFSIILDDLPPDLLEANANDEISVDRSSVKVRICIPQFIHDLYFWERTFQFIETFLGSAKMPKTKAHVQRFKADLNLLIYYCNN